MNTPTNPQGYPAPQQQQAASPRRDLGGLIANLGPQAAAVGKSTVDPRSLAAGIKPSFASVNFKGKTWGVRYRGVTQQLLAMGPQGEILGAIPTIDVVIVKAATAISKAFYVEKWKDGSFASPDCWSTNGQVPDLGASKKQSDTCKGCRWDAFGSRTTDEGHKAKACSDNKRLAVVPSTDLKNEAYGGPMLLKLTPSGFNALSELEVQLHMQGYSYFGIVMRLSFDHQAAFPKILFTPVRTLTEAEAEYVVHLQGTEMVDRILSEELIEVTGDPEQPDQQAHQAQAAPAAPAEAPPAVALHVAPPPGAVTPGVTTGFGQPAPSVQSVPSGHAPVDDLKPPTFLQRGGQPTLASVSGTIPKETPEQQKIRELEAQLAAAKAPPAPVETPEQKKIRELEEQLAAAKAGSAQPAVQAKPPRRTRTKPVTPADTANAATGALPGDRPLPFQPTAAAPADAAEAAQAAQAPLTNGAATDDDQADAPGDLASRIDSLLKTPGQTPNT